MKDIIRQAVADAAEWLYQNRGAVGERWLEGTSGEHILKAHAKASQFDAEKRRKEQLADFVAKPVMPPAAALAAQKTFTDNATPVLADIARRIDSALVVGPGGEIAHGFRFIGRCVMVDVKTGPDGKVSAREHASKPGRYFNKDVELPAPSDPKWSVAVTASFDGAEGEGRVCLSTQEYDQPMIAIEGRQNAATLAGMLIDWVQPDVVVVPRALLERLAKVGGYGNVPNDDAREAIKALTDLLK